MPTNEDIAVSSFQVCLDSAVATKFLEANDPQVTGQLCFICCLYLSTRIYFLISGQSA